MEQFLKVVATGYRKRYSDISRLTFIMPNKRSGTFLLREFVEQSGRPEIAPRVISISDFIAINSDYVIDSRLDLIFRLYGSYRKISGNGKEMAFDKFSSWGETLLSDFNEIDMQMADPEEIFKNVYDFNTIRSNFLSPRHRKVMAQYFGYSEDYIENNIDHLWQKLEAITSKPAQSDKPGSKFRSLWASLGPLYNAFKEDLKNDGLTTSGGAYRNVADKVEGGFEPFPGEKIVFVGFNALSESENRIFNSLKEMTIKFEGIDEPKADFVWDSVSEALVSEEDPATKFVEANRSKENFPNPDWLCERLKLSMPEKAPVIKVISVPSNVIQAKIAGYELEEIIKKFGEKKVENAKVAIVLPDENLLLPLLYSLPDTLSNPNLTMGFPLKQTPVISFASLIKKLQTDSIRSGKQGLFFFEDVRDLLGHPYCSILFDKNKANKFIKDYEQKRKIMVPGNILSSLGGNAAMVFRSFNQDSDSEEIIQYLLDILNKIHGKLSDNNTKTYIQSKVEKIYISTYVDALIRLSNCLKEYSFPLTPYDVFSLADKMIGGETVVFEGQPLQGLQIMGVLETRCLDFDAVIMLSMNEKVMPKVGRNSSFIPNVIRMAFAMPPANYQEEIFAYYFFRLIGRSKECVLTYDSRSSENRTPGPSRYLLQMKYLPQGLTLNEYEAKFKMYPQTSGIVEIQKTGEVAEGLRKYENGTKNFSASGLKHYFSCPVKFMFNDVLDIRIDQEKLETIDAAALGTIVHRSIERLYFPVGKRGEVLTTPVLMTAKDLENLLQEGKEGEESTLVKAARRSILEVHFGMKEEVSEAGELSGSARILLDYIVEYIRYIIEEDIRLAPFRLWGSEIEEVINYKLPDGREVRFKMIIDRLDQEGAVGDTPFRIVDYKTGKVYLEAETLENVFDGSYQADNIFQLLLYAELFIMGVRNQKITLPSVKDIDSLEKNLKILIYDITELPSGKGVKMPKIDRIINEKNKIVAREIKCLGDLRCLENEKNDKFMTRLHQLIYEILDDKKSFSAEPSDENCIFCDFRLNCELLRRT